MAKKSINGIEILEEKFYGSIISIGNGKSAYFFAAATPSTTPFVILTEHGNKQQAVESIWDDEILHPITQSDSIEKIIARILAAKSGEPITLICSTDPQRFHHWLNLILPKIPEEKKRDIIFLLPQSPNFEFEHLAQLGFTTAILDYYPGIGGVKHDEKSLVSEATAGVKEEILCSVANLENFSSRTEMLLNNLRYLTVGQNLSFESNYKKFFFMPTNAILHMVGNITHIAESLVEKSILDQSILEAKTAKEFFEKFEEGTKDLSREDIIEAVGTSLKGKGFYRQMPAVGPDILMRAASDEIKKATAHDSEFKDLPSISSHLRSKYAKQWKIANDMNPHAVSFSEFIHKNPPYQNPQIVVPTRDDDKIKTLESRFYTEEHPTLKWITEIAAQQGIADDELPTLKRLIAFGEKMMGKEVEKKPDENCHAKSAELAEKKYLIKSKL